MFFFSISEYHLRILRCLKGWLNFLPPKTKYIWFTCLYSNNRKTNDFESRSIFSSLSKNRQYAVAINMRICRWQKTFPDQNSLRIHLLANSQGLVKIFLSSWPYEVIFVVKASTNIVLFCCRRQCDFWFDASNKCWCNKMCLGKKMFCQGKKSLAGTCSNLVEWHLNCLACIIANYACMGLVMPIIATALITISRKGHENVLVK